MSVWLKRWQCNARALALSLIAGAVMTGAGLARAADDTPPAPQSVPVTQLPGWSQDRLDGLRQAIARQCALRTPPAPWPQLCRELPPVAELRAWIERRFVAWPLADDKGRREGLITGYHEPLLSGSLQRENDRQTPLYSPPPEVASIAQSAANPSGRVLIERGALSREDATAPGIKAWLRANPALAAEVMQSNPRYVFFRRLEHSTADGPFGSLGVPLTPGRSIATDRSRIPHGALMYLDGIDPIHRRPMRMAVVSQDTGGAILGTVRADVFWGAGDEAEKRAGLMRENGRLWLLWPADMGPPAIVHRAP